MTLHAVYFALDHLAMYSLTLLVLSLLLKYPRNYATYVALLIGISTAAYVYYGRVIFGPWIPEPYRFQNIESVISAIQVIMNTIPAAFMVLAFLLFEDSGRKFPRVLIGLLILQICLEDLLPFLFGVTTRPSLAVPMTDNNPALYGVFELLPAVLQAVFVTLALFWTLKEWRVDLVNPRRRMRLFLVVLIAVNLVSYTLLTRLVMDPNDTSFFHVHEAYQAFNLLMNSAVLVYLLVVPDDEKQVAPSLKETPVAADHVDPDFRLFEAAMKGGLYHETGLTIASLASHIKVPEYRLRKLINQKLGHRNFNQMLNHYRIDEVAAALADPAKRHLPILTLALSAGYQSINPFNRAFRELKDTTPSAFRQAMLPELPGETGEAPV